jgi:iron complex outermembrane receptor protein
MAGWTRTRSGVASAAGAALVLAAQPHGASAQGTQQLERVEITGSSVRRIDAESALPVQVLTREDIRRSGATSVVDLLRQVPAIQGSVGETASLAGYTYGFASVSIHNFQETRTLVLINGHRVTSFGGQTLNGFAAAFDINALPIASIERIEILTDGASAVYGADATAGVVNVITRRNSTEGDVTLGVSYPSGGAREKRFSVSKGFGSLAEDGHNLFLSLAHEERSPLAASKRSYARSGQIDFTGADGQRYRVSSTSTYAVPANVYEVVGGEYVVTSLYLRANGSCPANHYRVTDGAGSDYCGYDYASQAEIYPERQRTNFMASWTVKANADHELFADLLLARSRQTTRTAPALGPLLIEPGTPFHTAYLAPLGITDATYADYRVGDLGQRVNEDTADFGDLAIGSRGRIAGWDYHATYAHSESRVKANVAGHVGGLAVNDRVNSGALNPFVGIGEQTAAGRAALESLNYRGYWDGGVAKLDTLALRGSRELIQMPAGPLTLGTGVTLTQERYRADPSAFAQGLLADPVLGTPADAITPGDLRSDSSLPVLPYSVSRRSVGVFGELVIPVARQFELTTALRHDHFDDFGNATTAKGTFRWTPSAQWLVRGSVGTGFHAPSVPQTRAPQQSYGVTAAYYDCAGTPLEAQATRVGALCRPGPSQYDVTSGGNGELKAEKSIQGTLGLRFEPSRSWSLGADLWHLQIRDAIGQLPEDVAFSDPSRYANSFIAIREAATGVDYLGYQAVNQNLGKQFATGIDVDFSGRVGTGMGMLTSRLTVTRMLREVSQLQPDSEYHSAIGGVGALGYATFKWIGRLSTSLNAGHWTHTVAVNARSGYLDREETVQPIDASGTPTGPAQPYRLKLKRYATVDWQTAWRVHKAWQLTLGALNVFDRDPPLSIATQGLNRGQQMGFDDRYYDPRGRVFYANASYQF